MIIRFPKPASPSTPKLKSNPSKPAGLFFSPTLRNIRVSASKLVKNNPKKENFSHMSSPLPKSFSSMLSGKKNSLSTNPTFSMLSNTKNTYPKAHAPLVRFSPKYSDFSLISLTHKQNKINNNPQNEILQTTIPEGKMSTEHLLQIKKRKRRCFFTFKKLKLKFLNKNQLRRKIFRAQLVKKLKSKRFQISNSSSNPTEMRVTKNPLPPFGSNRIVESPLRKNTKTAIENSPKMIKKSALKSSEDEPLLISYFDQTKKITLGSSKPEKQIPSSRQFQTEPSEPRSKSAFERLFTGIDIKREHSPHGYGDSLTFFNSAENQRQNGNSLLESSKPQTKNTPLKSSTVRPSPNIFARSSFMFATQVLALPSPKSTKGYLPQRVSESKGRPSLGCLISPKIKSTLCTSSFLKTFIKPFENSCILNKDLSSPRQSVLLSKRQNSLKKILNSNR